MPMSPVSMEPRATLAPAPFGPVPSAMVLRLVTPRAEPMAGLGFHDAGQYTIEEIPGVNLWAFVNPSEAAYGVVYEHPMAGVAVDFVTQYEDGTGITYTTAPQGDELDRRPGHDKVYLKEASTEELYRKFLKGRPQGARKPVSAQGFAVRPAAFLFRDDQGHEVEFTAPYAVGKVRRTTPLALDEFLFVRTPAADCGTMPKITLPAPSTMHFYRCSDFRRA